MKVEQTDDNQLLQNFRFLPKGFPRLNEQVHSICWESEKKQLFVVMGETKQFDVFRWITYINNEWADMQKSPFVDETKSYVTLLCKDAENNDLAEFKFTHLNVKNCNVQLVRLAEKFIYHITLQYQHVQFAPHQTKAVEQEIRKYRNDDDRDEEWRKPGTSPETFEVS
jgi:hypothetical protein